MPRLKPIELSRSSHLPQLLAIPRTAFELSISVRQAYELIAKGDLELVKIGRASRVTSSSVQRVASKRAKTARVPKLKQFRQELPASNAEKAERLPRGRAEGGPAKRGGSTQRD
jgi:hypothetical protein